MDVYAKINYYLNQFITLFNLERAQSKGCALCKWNLTPTIKKPHHGTRVGCNHPRALNRVYCGDFIPGLYDEEFQGTL